MTAVGVQFVGFTASIRCMAKTMADMFWCLFLQVKGLFWNYFSIGLDAQAAYGFHSLREKHPWAAPSRMINQGWYSYFSCTTGWFGPIAPPVRNKVVLKVQPPTSPITYLPCLMPLHSPYTASRTCFSSVGINFSYPFLHEYAGFHVAGEHR